VRVANNKTQKRPWTQHKNPLTNKLVLFRLNPYAKTLKRQEIRRQERVKARKAKGDESKGKKRKAEKAAGEAFLKTLFAP
jgi:large subunit ribosomal protein L4e